jgi:adenine-specific DNA methylase
VTAEASSRSTRKQLGAFYTPTGIAAKLVDWAIRTPDARVIDPSFGGFVFLELARERLLALGAERQQLQGTIYGVDTDQHALRLARKQHDLADVTLIHADFFSLEPTETQLFTANIGNPPYIRYQSWDAEASRAHAITAAMGVKLTRLSSIWAPFILHGCRFLTPGGRLAQVLPAELLHAQYARPVIDYLTRSFRQVTVAIFDERVFPDALEEVVLLFADGYGDGPAPGMGVVSARDDDDVYLAMIDGKGRGYFSPDNALLRLLPRHAQRLYERLERDARVRRLGEIATVDIGAVTGANDFFIRTRDEIHQRGFAPELFKTIVSKASDVAGARLSKRDVEALAARARTTELLSPNGHSREELASIAELIAEGERLGLPKRYKCRIRSPWWSVPLPKRGVPDGLLTYMSDAIPRLVRNEAGALSTNTIHNVTVGRGVSAAALAVAFYNSLTLLSAELVGRSYGGGILKLEPTEAERLLIPPFDRALSRRLRQIDRLLRGGDVEAVVDIVDPLVLTPLGLSEGEIAALRTARRRLFTRRRTRSKKNGK